MEEIKAAIEALQKSVAEFRKANDQAMADKASKGHVDALLAEKVEKLNTAISENQAKLQKHLDAVEKKLNRFDMLGDVPKGDLAKVQAEMKAFNEQKEISENGGFKTVEAYQGYQKALNRYFRKGEASLPNEIKALLHVGSDPEGGYYVAPDSGGRIVEFIRESSPLRQLASVMSISTDALEGVHDLDEAGSGGWVGERQARTGDTNTPALGMYRIPVHEQYAEPKATQKMLDDSAVSIEPWLSRKVGNKLARVENTSFISGDGVLKPRGILTYPAGTPTSTAFRVIQQVRRPGCRP